MLKKYAPFTLVFTLIFLSELIAVAENLIIIRWVTKPLIAISLILFLHFTIKLKSRFTNRIKVGLVFSWLGDIFLMLTHKNQIFFMLGLGAFLVAHLFYISASYLDSTNKIEVKKGHILPIFLIFGALCLSYYYLLRPYLGSMNIPVLVYSFVITIMGIMAALRYGKTNNKSFILILVGAILFLISDSILAYNKFVEQLNSADLLIMSTYMLAQFLITMGAVERKFVKKN